MKRALISMIAVVILLVSSSHSAMAWSTQIGGEFGESSTRYFTTPRTVNMSPWEIAAMRTGGTTGYLNLKWYGCDGSTGAGYFTPVRYGNWSWLRSGQPWWTRFCIAAQGTPWSDFTATLDWDYDPYPLQPYVVPND